MILPWRMVVSILVESPALGAVKLYLVAPKAQCYADPVHTGLMSATLADRDQVADIPEISEIALLVGSTCLLSEGIRK